MLIKVIIIFLSLILSVDAVAYTPPKGIPDPALSFGSFGEIDQDPPTTGSGGARCTGWPSTTSDGCYYVDNSVSCNDTNCTNRGCPSTPRCTLPDMSALAAGTYIEVHGGVGTAYSSSLSLAAAGTDSNPVWIVGVADGEGKKPMLNAKWNVPSNAGGDAALDYTVITGFKMAAGTAFDLRPRAADGYVQTINHLIIRDIEIEGSSNATDTTFLGVGGANPRSGSYTKNVVIYDNKIHGIGDPDLASETCAIYINTATNVWILNNIVYDIEEDAIAGCDQCNDDHRPKGIFIGGNTLSHPGANTIDLKKVDGAIISGNTLSGNPFTSRCPNDGCGAPVYHYSGEATKKYCTNIWTIFNTIHDIGSPTNLKNCIGCQFIGNVVYDATCETPGYCETSEYYAPVINSYSKDSGAAYIVDNTIYNSNGMISASLGTGASISVTGNLLVGRTNASAYELLLDSAGAGVTVDYNMFKGGSADNASAFRVGSTGYTYANFKGLASAPCAHCKDYVADSLTIGFINEGGNDFRLTAASSAIGANTESPVYDYFNTIWTTETTGLCDVYGVVCTGLSIHYDKAGNARPIDTWDIGAYEYDPATVRSAMSIGAGAGVSIGSGATMTLY